MRKQRTQGCTQQGKKNTKMAERKVKKTEREEKKVVRTPEKISKSQGDLGNKELINKKISATAMQGVANNDKASKCYDKNCHIHGNLKIRGRIFEGVVIKKFHKRVVIEFERMVYVSKYERYKKSKTKIHARLQECMEDKINVGDYIKIQECRPLSKLIHFIVIEKIRGGEGK